jgi:hypothetical protein
MKNWNDVFKPLLTTNMLSSCKSSDLVEYILDLGDVTEEQWAEFFYQLLRDISHLYDTQHRIELFKKYQEHLNLSLLVSKMDFMYMNNEIRTIFAKLLLYP